MSGNERHRKEIVLAAARFLEFSKRIPIVGSIEFPDDSNRTTKEIDIKFKLGPATIVGEHTRIESFPEQIKASKVWQHFFTPLSALVGQLSEDSVFELHFHVQSLAFSSRKEEDKVRNSLAQWIKSKAPGLTPHRSSFLDTGTFVREVPPGVPFKVTLSRRTTTYFPGSLRQSSEINGSLQSQRETRIATALHSKLPKLHNAKLKAGSGALSVLILESDDIALGNHIEIYQGLRSVLSGSQRLETPDEVYLVETENSGFWLLSTFREHPTGWVEKNIHYIYKNETWKPFS